MADAEVQAQNKRKRMFEEAEVITNELTAQSTVEKNNKEAMVVSIRKSMSAEIASFVATKTATGLTNMNMLKYIWLQNIDKTSTFPKIQTHKPKDIHCFADPTADFCYASSVSSLSGLSYSCSAAKVCSIVITASDLDMTNDRIRLGQNTHTEGPCAHAHTGAPGTGLYSPETGPNKNQLVFKVGQGAAVATDYSVCYCHAKAHSQGCSVDLIPATTGTGALPITSTGASLSSAYEQIGTLTVTA